MIDRPRDPTLPIGIALAGVAGVLRLRPLGAPDLWWHLSSGRAVLEERAIRFPDPVSIAPLDEFVAHEWGFDVLALWLWELGGSAALVAFAAAMAAASCLLVFALARSVGGPQGRWAALAVTAAVAAATGIRFFPRPHILFLVLLSATLLFARSAARAQAREQLAWLAGLLVVVAAWSQCHPSVVIAPAVVAGIGVPWVFGRRLPGDPDRMNPAMWIVFAAVCAIPLLSPEGTAIFDQVIRHSGTDSTAHIGEMHPMPIEWWWPPNGRTILIVECMVVVGVVASVRARRLAIGPAALALLGLVMTLNTHRFRSAWAILMTPWVVDAVVVASGRQSRRLVAVAVAVLGLSVTTQARGWAGPDLGLDPAWVPTDLGEAVVEHAVEGPIFNDYDSGGFLGWTLYGKARVFIDGRTPLFFTDEHFFATRKALGDVAVFDRLDSGYSFTAAVVPHDAVLCRGLGESDRWDAVWGGPRRTLFLRASQPRAVVTPCRQSAK